jgi:hypothetical protein
MSEPRQPEANPGDQQGGERTPETKPIASNANSALDPQEGERRSFSTDVEQDGAPGGERAADKP